MKELYGWAGKVCFVDLDRKTSHVEPTEKYLSFIGGRGINEWLLFTLLEKDVDPLGPDNVLILGAGPMVGTLVPSASRLSIEHKNVITGGVGSGNCGGRFAAEMKYAGYDHIVVVGKADQPTYIYIEGDNVHFRDASDIWGKGPWETDNAIKSKEKDIRISTLTIGIAGENLVNFACIIGDRGRAAAYGGGGAVMGSKNLKAIAVRGKGSPIRLAKPDKFINRLRRFEKDIFEKSEAVKQYRWGGTVGPYARAGENRHGVRNMSSEFWSNESLKNVTREKFDEYLVRRHSCFSCPVFCSAIYEVNGVVCEGIQANSLRAFGTNVDVTSPQDILFAHALVNLYGLDCDQTSAAIAWAIECYERGIIDRSDTEGLELKFGDGSCVTRLIEKIAHRKGLGDVLARGVYEASKTVGRGSEKLTALVKKTSVMEAGVRSHKGWALGIMTSTKGAGHLRGAPSIERRRVPPEVSKKLFGIDDIPGPTAYNNKASLVVWQERYKGLVDMMGICALTSMWQDIDLFRPEDIAGFLSDITGMDYEAEGLLDSGERLQNLERSFNLLHSGFDRSDDMPPRRFIDMPIDKGIYEGESLDVDMWNQMLDEYYEAHGWETVTGWPTKKRLLELELDAVANKLARNGIFLS